MNRTVLLKSGEKRELYVSFRGIRGVVLRLGFGVGIESTQLLAARQLAAVA